MFSPFSATVNVVEPKNNLVPVLTFVIVAINGLSIISQFVFGLFKLIREMDKWSKEQTEGQTNRWWEIKIKIQTHR